jgi:hypothetical protein
MAVYVYNTTTGALYSWSPNDTDPVADQATLTANGLSIGTGLPALDATHAWNAAQRTVVTVTPPTPANVIDTFDFIMAFTAAELAGIRASSDNNIQQFLFALQVTQGVNLNHATITNALTYLVSKSLLTAQRAQTIGATVTSGAT